MRYKRKDISEGNTYPYNKWEKNKNSSAINRYTLVKRNLYNLISKKAWRARVDEIYKQFVHAFTGISADEHTKMI